MKLIKTDNLFRKGAEVPEIEWCKPGESGAFETLMGNKNGFLATRLKNYATDRNDPFKQNAVSGLSPYLHFGQISAQRCALEANKLHKLYPQVCSVRNFLLIVLFQTLSNINFIIFYFFGEMKAVDKFLDELIVWKELADNFCYYEPHYDLWHGAWDWARTTLRDHSLDKRDHIYT